MGSIQDEYDDEEEEISRIGEDVFLLDGLADLEEVAKVFDFILTEEETDEFETIGGYIIHQLGYIPTEEDHPEITVREVLFTVEEMEERRISKLRARRLPPSEQPVFQGTVAVE